MTENVIQLWIWLVLHSWERTQFLLRCIERMARVCT